MGPDGLPTAHQCLSECFVPGRGSESLHWILTLRGESCGMPGPWGQAASHAHGHAAPEEAGPLSSALASQRRPDVTSAWPGS